MNTMGKPRKKTTKNKSADAMATSSLRKIEAIIFPIILGLLFVVFIISKASGEERIDENILIGSFVFFTALMVISIPRSSGREVRKRTPRPRGGTRSQPSKKGKPVLPSRKRSVVREDIDEEELARKERKIISYPSTASGGKYGDAYVAISGDVILKVRSMLAVSCRNCRDLDSCWEKHKDSMDYETFLDRTECLERMDPDVISAAPPVKVTEEATEEETVISVEESMEGDVEYTGDTGEVTFDEGAEEADGTFDDWDTGDAGEVDFDSETAWDDTGDAESSGNADESGDAGEEDEEAAWG